MTHYELCEAMEGMTILYDTREQDTPALRRRLEMFPCKSERHYMKFGDYSAQTTLSNGKVFSLDGIVGIERKMSLTELSGNFTKGRARFSREFEKAHSGGGKLYLVVEGASWENINRGLYRTQFAPKSFTASLCAWQARYNTQIIFCSSEYSPMMIYHILYYELKERLERGDADE
jgi:hypothetical protein